MFFEGEQRTQRPARTGTDRQCTLRRNLIAVVTVAHSIKARPEVGVIEVRVGRTRRPVGQLFVSAAPAIEFHVVVLRGSSVSPRSPGSSTIGDSAATSIAFSSVTARGRIPHPASRDGEPAVRLMP